ncbi:hypothetical protein [Dyadobacter fanqingshengii]|uniref:Uncharacterized protein n=1 Tax=Dyadobacter fanqingshengii TaxID=2906443 RepID=A0A9X1T813_9BACT|nr:hypothetical protein [Dyadobacter fanqingshengii]MCF0039680.1 hypothetical protein [Dyadobacter fanqingshengii]USJ38555.1 hypothetical protein NFI81_12395 [Dyadobacter fanqingshengii]
MEQGYVLEWLDRAINEFNPTQTQSANFEDHRFLSFSEEMRDEKARQVAYLKKLAFQYPKKRRFQEVLNSYFSALNSLIDNAKLNLKLIASESGISKKALELVVATLADIHTFLMDRYAVSINPDEPLRKYNLAVPVIDFVQPADSILLSYHPSLASLLEDEFNTVFGTGNLANITSRQAEYWKDLNEMICIPKQQNPGDGYFDSLELLLIERNFNSTKFVKYLTNRFNSQIEEYASGNSIEKLAYIQKSFNQIPVIKGLAYDLQHDDLSLTINNWFICEIEFRSRSNAAKGSESLSTASQSPRYTKKTADKVLCKLTVDQLALLFKAADQSKIITAKSLSAIFQAVAPYLATPYKEDISHGSLRSKSYSVEGRDKEQLLSILAKLTCQIEEL